MANASIDWLCKAVFPLWLERGVDWKNGGFCEALGLNGETLHLNRRAMVQARQIYSFRTALTHGWIPEGPGREAVARGAEFLIANYSDKSGAFFHAVDAQGVVVNRTPELYTQAFALFGLANAYAVQPTAALKSRAVALMDYLRRERSLPEGGFSELRGSEVAYEANPHMHLFEAAIGWMEVDKDPLWRGLADDLLELLHSKIMMDGASVCEHFSPGWRPLRSDAGKFVVEPGHLYEWSWLLGRYQDVTKIDLFPVRQRLFATSETHGINNSTHAVYDELWSDSTVKSSTSRFWPQCERIKAAAQLALVATDRKPYVATAEQAMKVLQRYFTTPTPGLWFDSSDDEGKFRQDPAKASSLYHIIGAISEYARL